MSVTAESPLVDIRNNARQTNIRAEQVDLLPHGRDFTTLVTQAPGANQESKLGGLSIDGASAGENRYIIDGIETTNLQSGTSGKSVIADFVEEVQVKSSGYTAEFGGATGGVINVVTKSGTNNLHGLGMFNVQGSAMDRLAPPDAAHQADGLERFGVHHLSRRRLHPHRAGVRPRRPDRLQQGVVLRRVSARADDDRSLGVAADRAESCRQQHLRPRRRNRLQFILAQHDDSVRTERSLARIVQQQLPQAGRPAAGAERPPSAPDTNYGKISEFPNWSLSGNVDWTASPRILVSARGGYYNSDVHDSNVTEQPLYRTTTTSSVGLARSAGQPADPCRVHEHPVEHQDRSRSADPRLLPGRRHDVRVRLAASTSSSSACRSTALATTC